MAPNNYPLPPRKDTRLRYMPDTSEQIAQSVRSVGYKERLASVFRAAIARAKGKR